MLLKFYLKILTRWEILSENHRGKGKVFGLTLYFFTIAICTGTCVNVYAY